MEMYILRQKFNKRSTEGLFVMNDTRVGYVLEDRHRILNSLADKVPKETAIPAGRYEVKLTMSNRFKKILPELLNVPFFSGVRLHGGNTHEDTEGCPLLASGRTLRTESIYGSLSDFVVKTLTINPGPHHIEVIDCWPGGYTGD